VRWATFNDAYNAANDEIRFAHLAAWFRRLTLRQQIAVVAEACAVISLLLGGIYWFAS
jgi:hypothetical protein